MANHLVRQNLLQQPSDSLTPYENLGPYLSSQVIHIIKYKCEIRSVWSTLPPCVEMHHVANALPVSSGAAQRLKWMGWLNSFRQPLRSIMPILAIKIVRQTCNHLETLKGLGDNRWKRTGLCITHRKKGEAKNTLYHTYRVPYRTQ